MSFEWDERLAAWRDELELLAKMDTTMGTAGNRGGRGRGLSRSALRAWHRNGEIPSRRVDGPHGPATSGAAAGCARSGRAVSPNPAPRRARDQPRGTANAIAASR